RHPHLPVDDAHVAKRDVVRPQIEGGAAAQVEAGMMPMAGENAIFDAAAVERKAHMRAAVVERNHVIAVGDNGAAGRSDHHTAAVAQFVERADANEATAGVVHPCSCNTTRQRAPAAMEFSAADAEVSAPAQTAPYFTDGGTNPGSWRVPSVINFFGV